MFNKYDMENEAEVITSKLSKTFGFRVNPEWRERLEKLAADTGRDISEILRDGLQAYWPEIEALNYQLGRRATSEQLAQLRAWMQAGQQASALGIDLSELIARETEAAAIRRAEQAA